MGKHKMSNYITFQRNSVWNKNSSESILELKKYYFHENITKLLVTFYPRKYNIFINKLRCVLIHIYFLEHSVKCFIY